MNFENYKNNVPYPKKPIAPKIQINPTYEQALDYAEAIKIYNYNVEVYNEKLADWNSKESEIYARFKREALEEVGLAGHPKADKVFSKAWEMGHSNGYSEVFSYLQDLAELVL